MILPIYNIIILYCTVYSDEEVPYLCGHNFKKFIAKNTNI